MSESTDESTGSVPGPRPTPPAPASGHATATGPEQASAVPEMRYVDLTGSREAAGRSIRMRDMARRLPQLVRRSLALAHRVDRRATIGLLLCQTAAGVMQALGLIAISGTLTALLTSGDV
ncbi:ABC transporter ATP-binding protein, partial [Streptomyces sp. NPDC002746]